MERQDGVKKEVLKEGNLGRIKNIGRTYKELCSVGKGIFWVSH